VCLASRFVIRFAAAYSVRRETQVFCGGGERDESIVSMNEPQSHRWRHSPDTFPSDEAAAWYLAAVLDTVGHVTSRPGKDSSGLSRGVNRDVRITNTNERLLAATETALTRFGITFTRYERPGPQPRGPDSKPVFDIIITHKDNFDRLLARVPMQTDKRDKLAGMVGSYVRKKKPPREELEKHLRAGMTNADIARMYGVTQAAVWLWCKRYGIDRDAR